MLWELYGFSSLGQCSGAEVTEKPGVACLCVFLHSNRQGAAAPFLLSGLVHSPCNVLEFVSFSQDENLAPRVPIGPLELCMKRAIGVFCWAAFPCHNTWPPPPHCVSPSPPQPEPRNSFSHPHFLATIPTTCNLPSSSQPAFQFPLNSSPSFRVPQPQCTAHCSCD